MEVFAFFKFSAFLLAIVALFAVLPLGMALYCGESQMAFAFSLPIAIVLLFAVFCRIFFRKARTKLSRRSGFVYVTSCWISASLFSSAIFALSGYFSSFTDCFFESVSGFSGTGCTVLQNLEALPKSLNLWRCEIHWLGGLGIVGLTVALMPLLGVGGFQLVKAETTGVDKGKITPKIADMSKILWLIYIFFTALQTILLKFCGLSLYDALATSFATISTGGFSTRTQNIGAYSSSAVNWICTIFMLIGGVNFSLYFLLFRRHFSEVAKNSELKAYILIFIVATFLVAASILPVYGSLKKAIEHSAFNVSSILTTTGFCIETFEKWPVFARMCLFLLYLVGGCSGSTSGGIKVVRWVVLSKQLNNEINRMIHPHGVYSISLDGRAGRKDLAFAVLAFLSAYFLFLLLTFLVVAADCGRLSTSLTCGLAVMGNSGLAFTGTGEFPNFALFSPFTKNFLSAMMISGRLEVFTVLILLSPAFWRKR